MTDFTLSSGKRVHLIGDPHMGRKFGPEQGVPRHRMGEREAKQAAHLSSELNVDTDINIMVGDLFDNPFVSELIAVSVANSFLSAAENNPDTTFIAIPGNHDLPKNLNAVGAWVTFRKMIENRMENLYVVEKPSVICNIALFPWEYARRSDAQVADLVGSLGVEAAVGHWDLSVFDSKDEHLAPTAELVAAFGVTVKIYSGHYHKPGIYTVKGVDVDCTGSLEPYTHGEDPQGLLYVTMTLADVLADPDVLKDKYVRVIVKNGEEVPEIDCLGLTHLREQTEAKIRDTLSLDDFDWQAILRKSMAGLSERVQIFIKERIHVDDPEEQHGGSNSDTGSCAAAEDTSQA